MKLVSNSFRMPVWWIRQSILQAEQSRIVRLPLNKIGSINKINKCTLSNQRASTIC
jgi:DNA-directed RNA polymerase sigma subunit (sigma70/sigma32)